VVILFEGRHGQLSSVVDASSITKIRTAGASGLATRYLARSDEHEPLTLGLLGSGVQAESHLEAMLAVRKIGKVQVWSRTFSKAQAFVLEASKKYQIPIIAIETVQATARPSISFSSSLPFGSL